MKIQNERLLIDKDTPRWILWEHLARFQFASKFVNNKVVLDCACGSGVGTKIFAESNAEKIYAFDIDNIQIEKNISRNCNPKITFQVADATKLPISNESIDVFISFETIEHINNDKDYLAEAKRVLKKNGVFICSTPNRNITNPGGKITDKPWNKFHVREYSTEEFINLTKNYFTLSNIYGQDASSTKKVKLITKVSNIISPKIGTYINKILKIPRFFIDSPRKYSLCELKKGKDYEYITIVGLNK